MGERGVTRPRAQRMRELVEEFEGSGLSVQAFAGKYGVAVTTLTWWLHVLRGDEERGGEAQRLAPAGTRSDEGEFREIRVDRGEQRSPGLVVRLAGGDVLRIPVGADGDTVRVVIEALKARC